MLQETDSTTMDKNIEIKGEAALSTPIVMMDSEENPFSGALANLEKEVTSVFTRVDQEKADNKSSEETKLSLDLVQTIAFSMREIQRLFKLKHPAPIVAEEAEKLDEVERKLFAWYEILYAILKVQEQRNFGNFHYSIPTYISRNLDVV